MKRSAADSSSSNNARLQQATRQIDEQRVHQNAEARPADPGLASDVQAAPNLYVPPFPRGAPLPLNGSTQQGLVPGLEPDRSGIPQIGTPPKLITRYRFDSIYPVGWETAPPHWRHLNARAYPAWPPMVLFPPPPNAVWDGWWAQTNGDGLTSVSSDNFTRTFCYEDLPNREARPATMPTKKGVKRAWDERQALVAIWKNESLRADLPCDVFKLIIQGALEGGAPDDVRPELVFLRNLGAVCKALAVEVEVVRGDPQWFRLRVRAAAHEDVILTYALSFWADFRKDFLRMRWHQPQMRRYDVEPGGIRLNGYFKYQLTSSEELGSHFADLRVALVDTGKLVYHAVEDETDVGEVETDTDEPGSYSDWTSVMDVRQHGDQITELSISCVQSYPVLDWLGSLNKLQSLDLSACHSEALPPLPTNWMMRLRKLTINSGHLQSWLGSGQTHPEGWHAMQELTINGPRHSEHQSQHQLARLPPNLQRLTVDIDWLSDDLVFPAELKALHITFADNADSTRQTRLARWQKLYQLPALTELRIEGFSMTIDNDLTEALLVFLSTKNHNLRVLSLPYHPESESEKLLPILTTFGSLEELELDFSASFKAFHLMSQIVRKHSSLRVLTLISPVKKCIVMSYELASFWEALEQSASLHSLTLDFELPPSPDYACLSRTLLAGLPAKNRNVLSVKPDVVSDRSELRRYLALNWRLPAEPKPPGDADS